MKKSLLAFASICLLPLAAYASDTPDLWITANGASQDIGDNIKTKTQVELRLPDFEEIGYFKLSQKFTTKLSEKWSLGTHPVFESSKKGDDWSNTYRLDLELNPTKFTLGENGPSISMRNRWELRWKEGKGSEIFHRIRQQTKATWKLEGGPFSSYSLANEIFYEEDKSEFTVNRFYPVMLGTKHADKVKASYYLLYQSKRVGTTSEWDGSFILGASFSL